MAEITTEPLALLRKSLSSIAACPPPSREMPMPPLKETRERVTTRSEPGSCARMPCSAFSKIEHDSTTTRPPAPTRSPCLRHLQVASLCVFVFVCVCVCVCVRTLTRACVGLHYLHTTERLSVRSPPSAMSMPDCPPDT